MAPSTPLSATRWRLLPLLAVSLLTAAAAEPPQLSFVARYAVANGGAEILSYAPADHALLTIYSSRKDGKGIEVIDLRDPAAPRRLRRIPMSSDAWLPIAANLADVTSVAADPAGRGIAAATLYPENNTELRGRVVIFDYRSGEVLRSLPTGFHPDAVDFSKDGRFLLIADEGEFTPGRIQAPGSLTVVDLTSVQAAADVRLLSADAARTYPFTEEFGITDAMLTGVRQHVLAALAPLRDTLEPEYVSELNGRVYVCLQENNAIAVFDLASRNWVDLFPLGTIDLVIDASDRDGAFGGRAPRIDKSITGLLMPDTIRAVGFVGRDLLITANEGDARANDAGDRMRLKHAGVDGPALDPQTRAQLKAEYGMDPLRDNLLGRLQVSKVDGDLTGDGKINRPTAFGTRSFSIIDGRSGERIYDSGPFFERYALSRDPESFNTNHGDARRGDTRSDNKGPEIEAAAAAVVDGKLWIALGAERQNGIYLFYAEDPTRPVFFGYANHRAEGDVSPESTIFITPQQRDDGRFLVVVGYEGSGTVGILEIIR